MTRRRLLVSLVGASALLLSWTSGASAFHLAKIAERPRVIVVERNPVYPRHYYEPQRREVYWHERDGGHWKKHWKHNSHGHHRSGLWHFHKD